MSLKHYFASANTGVGFMSLFENAKCGGFTYVIKGGSGTGKSGIMKKVARFFDEKGFSVECFHCSTDINSFDGVRICEKNISIVDGTAPHVQEVSLPGVNGRILDVGIFVDDKIKTYKNEIENMMVLKQKYYKDLYGYLRGEYALQKIQENNHKKFENSVFFDEIQKILKEINAKEQNKESKVRELFFDAIQENGIKNFVEENSYEKVFKINKDIFCLNQMMQILKEKLCGFGYDVLLLKNCVMPEMISAIVLPEKDIIICGESDGKNGHVCCDEELIKIVQTKAQFSLQKAKEVHRKIENIYIQHMNFKGVDKITKKLIDEIMKK